jgi:hypothetical protein
MSIYEMLRAKWLEAGIAVKDAVAPAALDRFEKKHRVSLPSEFRDFLLTVNGMQDGQVDEDLISFLSLEAIDQEANCKEISANEVELVIAEYCIYSHTYVMRISRSGDRSPVLVTDGEHEKLIAASFKDFLSQYLANPAKMAHCWA